MSGISLTASMRSNLLSLQNISGQVSSTQNKLSTGNKVNSAIDNPSSYYTALSLNNRADDLNALLDSMGQAVSTIKAATTALESATEFLEQASAVATQALETAKVPSKSFFEEKEGVLAVVSTWDELKSAIESGKQGNIVIYGHIEAQDTIALKAGQNLVGVGYYGVDEPDVDKFSCLSFDGLTTTAVNLADNAVISNLSFVFNNNQAYYTGGFYGGNNVVFENVDFKVFNTQQPLALINYVNAEFRGINNMYTPEGQNAFFFYGSINLKNNAQLNCCNVGVRGPTMELNDNCIVNIKGKSLQIPQLTLNDKATINIDSVPLGYSCIDINDSAFFNMSSAGVNWNNYGSTPCHFNINSASSIVNLYNNKYFASDGSDVTNTFEAVVGAGMHINGKYYEAENGSYMDNFKEIIIPDGFTYQQESWLGKVDLSWLAEQNANRSQTYDYKNKTQKESGNYQEIINQYDSLIKDASYKGINLLQNDKLTVKFNESNTSDLSVQGKDMSSQALGFTIFDWQTQADIAESLSEIANALKSIRNYSAELGNNYSIITTRQDFTESLINVLTEGADKLTLADMNEESANMLALQTRQQLAINSLSLASQASQSILKLF